MQTYKAVLLLKKYNNATSASTLLELQVLSKSTRSCLICMFRDVFPQQNFPESNVAFPSPLLKRVQAETRAVRFSVMKCASRSRTGSEISRRFLLHAPSTRLTNLVFFFFFHVQKLFCYGGARVSMYHLCNPYFFPWSI